MSFIGSDDLEKILKGKVTSFNKNNIIHSAYELTLGDEYFVTDSDRKQVLDDKNPDFPINPGQFALLETAEEIEIPKDNIGFISVKFSLKRRGLINVSGFHVDPGYKGNIIFAVYNAGSKSINLERGQKYFQLWLAKIDNHSKPYKGSINGISSDFINDLKGQPLSLTELDDKIGKVNEIRSRNRWLLSILVALSISIGFKLWWDWKIDRYDQGYQDGIKDKVTLGEIRKSINTYPIDSLLIKKIDSLISLKKEELSDEK